MLLDWRVVSAEAVIRLVSLCGMSPLSFYRALFDFLVWFDKGWFGMVGLSRDWFDMCWFQLS